MISTAHMIERLNDEEFLCRNEGAEDIADLLALASIHIKDLTARVAELEAWTIAYGHHIEDCDYIVNTLPCTCGWKQVRLALTQPDADGGDK